MPPKDSFVKTALIDLKELDRNNEMLQVSFWGELKGSFGWRPVAASAEFNGYKAKLLILIRKIGPGISLAYVPYGDFNEEYITNKEDFLRNLSKALKPLLPKEVKFIRYDLKWYTEGEGGRKVLLKTGKRLHKAAMNIQPPSTVMLDLTQTEEELLKGMKSKTRYNIRLARKKGVEIREVPRGDEEALKNWYEMYRETAKRDKIVLHSFEYYEKLFCLAETSGSVKLKLLQAVIDGETVAGIVLVINNNQGVYLYGASTNIKRNYMPNHLLQWEAIRAAMTGGCESYDFFGIPEENSPTHPMYGLYRFKTGFGGKIIHRCGCYDYALSGPLYFFYRMAEGLRKFYFKKVRKFLKK